MTKARQCNLRWPRTRVMKMLLVTGLVLLIACSHTERSVHDMTWSSKSPDGTLPEGAVRFSFVQVPKFHVGLRVSGLKEHLEAAQKRVVSVQFEIHCKHRGFALIRINSVDGFPVQSDAHNMWMEIANIVPGQDSGPFPGACWY
jgi:hypothetical protein